MTEFQLRFPCIITLSAGHENALHHRFIKSLIHSRLIDTFEVLTYLSFLQTQAAVKNELALFAFISDPQLFNSRGETWLTTRHCIRIMYFTGRHKGIGHLRPLTFFNRTNVQ